MPEPVALLSSVALQKEEFLEFARRVSLPGAKILIQPLEYYDIQIVRGDENIWLALGEDLHSSEDLHYEEGEEDTKSIVQKLGSYPQTYIIIDIGKYPNSQHLAVAFACAFAKRWPCVVDNLEGDNQQIFSAQEICQLHEKGLGFWDQK